MERIIYIVVVGIIIAIIALPVLRITNFIYSDSETGEIRFCYGCGVTTVLIVYAVVREKDIRRLEYQNQQLRKEIKKSRK